MGIAAHEVGIGRVLVMDANGLVKRDCGQAAAIDIAQKLLAILQMFRAILRAWSEARVIIERLVMRLEIDRAIFARVDHTALLGRRAPAVRNSGVPPATVPGPGHALIRER